MYRHYYNIHYQLGFKNLESTSTLSLTNDYFCHSCCNSYVTLLFLSNLDYMGNIGQTKMGLLE